jgi:hypothetical protein
MMANNKKPGTAVLTVHGVGSHLPLSTLASTAKCLGLDPIVDSEQTVRAEIGGKICHVTFIRQNNSDYDLYEAYYSPIPKGKSSILDILSFLFIAGFSALGGKSLKRIIFRQRTDHMANYSTHWALLFILATLGSLLVINFLFTGDLVLLIRSGIEVMGNATPHQERLTLLVGFNFTYLFFVGMLLFMTRLTRWKYLAVFANFVFNLTLIVIPLSLCVYIILEYSLNVFDPSNTKPLANAWLTPFMKGGRLIGAFVIIALSLHMVSAPICTWLSKKLKKEGVISTDSGIVIVSILSVFLLGLLYFLTPLGTSISSSNVRQFDMINAGIFFFVASLFIRWFILNFAGDMTSYMSGSKSSKFAEVREDVKDNVTEMIEYLEKNYSQIIVVGHSLGSVVTYDAINNHLVTMPEKQISGIHTYITYGSPLDKFAYLFQAEDMNSSSFRPFLVYSRQPLISKAIRKDLLWMNVYSRFDPVSGALNYYDPEGKTIIVPTKVNDRENTEKEINDAIAFFQAKSPGSILPIVNINDTQNVVPLVSHSEYTQYSGLKAALQIALKRYVTPNG